MTAFFIVLRGGGWAPGQALASHDPLYLQGTTACLATIVVMQIGNLFLCRHPVESALRTRLFSNPLIFTGLALEIALIVAIVYTPAGNALFGTAPLPWSAWSVAAGLALAMFAAEEIRKAVVRAIFTRASVSNP